MKEDNLIKKIDEINAICWFVLLLHLFWVAYNLVGYLR